MLWQVHGELDTDAKDGGPSFFAAIIRNLLPEVACQKCLAFKDPYVLILSYHSTMWTLDRLSHLYVFNYFVDFSQCWYWDPV